MAERLSPYGWPGESGPRARGAADLAFELAHLVVLVLAVAVEEAQDLRQLHRGQGTLLGQQRGGLGAIDDGFGHGSSFGAVQHGGWSGIPAWIPGIFHHR